MRSEITIDLGALRHNVETLRRRPTGAEVWAVVKANGYGHGAADCARTALEAGAQALCVATIGEALALRAAGTSARILVLGPTSDDDVVLARGPPGACRLERRDPGGSRGAREARHRHGPLGRLRAAGAEPVDVVGVMTHLATADTDADFARTQIDRFRAATEPLRAPDPARREQRSGAPHPRVALRRRALRHRALRAFAVRRRRE